MHQILGLLIRTKLILSLEPVCRKWLRIDEKGVLAYVTVLFATHVVIQLWHKPAAKKPLLPVINSIKVEQISLFCYSPRPLIGYPLQADKHTLITELGVPSRDLRILDPNVGPYHHLNCRFKDHHYLFKTPRTSTADLCSAVSCVYDPQPALSPFREFLTNFLGVLPLPERTLSSYVHDS